ncbi:MAG: hypothetical protein IJT94_16320 [Oscillibacter sp.]|nr:hypothetical protein [Oscillibacter sp.]
MPAQWTGVLIGEIHNAGLTIKEVAREARLNQRYVSQVLNSECGSQKARIKLESALGRLRGSKQSTVIGIENVGGANDGTGVS